LRTITHISDLHFGRADPAVLPFLRDAICKARPDILVVSGDLTQRARREEFEAVRAFLQTLPSPQIVVPGNHDIPLYDVLSRWLTPLRNFTHYITPNLQPVFEDEEVAVIGVNTARSWSFKEGRINESQVASACQRLRTQHDRVVRVVVTHHPFVLPDSAGRHGIVGRAEMAMTGFSDCKLDLVLSGHLHVSGAVTSVAKYGNVGRSTLLVQAGTATSSRRRNEPNAFNIVRINRPTISVEHVAWSMEAKTFLSASSNVFFQNGAGWEPADE
jgi:3',5'-cyclic AMP phosphodiesterase CpdA